MPELPEVEIVVQGLLRFVCGQKCQRWVVPSYSTLLKSLDFNISHWNGKRLVDVQRKGKYILFLFDEASPLLSHLRMTGRWEIRCEGRMERHDRLLCQLENKKWLVFNDVRQFGTLTNSLTALDRLGQDALTEVNQQSFSQQLKCSSRPIKNFLLDQSRVAGLGNIYVNEILFRSKVSPFLKVSDVSASQVERLYKEMLLVLKEAIECGGSTIKDYVNLMGQKGWFSQNYFVYQREGQPCLICQDKICKVQLSGRGTFFCLQCQTIERGRVKK